MQSWSGPLNLKCPLLPFSIQLFQIKGEVFTRLNRKCFLFLLIFKGSTFPWINPKCYFFLFQFSISFFTLLSMWDPVHRKTLLLRPALVTALDFSTRSAPQSLKRISQGPQPLKRFLQLSSTEWKGEVNKNLSPSKLSFVFDPWQQHISLRFIHCIRIFIYWYYNTIF